MENESLATQSQKIFFMSSGRLRGEDVRIKLLEYVRRLRF